MGEGFLDQRAGHASLAGQISKVKLIWDASWRAGCELRLRVGGSGSNSKPQGLLNISAWVLALDIALNTVPDAQHMCMSAPALPFLINIHTHTITLEGG